MPSDAFDVFNKLNKTPPPTLYHYTSLEVLLSLVKSKRLWASNVRYLNDLSEYVYVFEFIIEQIDRLLDLNGEGDRDALITLRDRLTKLNGNAYISSFSEKRDDLSQWRAYAPQGVGVCIGFDTKSLQNVLQRSNVSDGDGYWRLAKVEYVDSKYGNNFKGLAEFMNRAVFQDEGNVRAKVMSDLLSRLAPFFKHVAFKDEAEWRVMYASREDQQDSKGIQFRVGKSTLIPYMELDLALNEGSFLDEVIIGPTPNMDLSYAALEAFLKSRGEEQIIVTSSAVPFRHW